LRAWNGNGYRAELCIAPGCKEHEQGLAVVVRLTYIITNILRIYAKYIKIVNNILKIVVIESFIF
jgi:hypothetical protein